MEEKTRLKKLCFPTKEEIKCLESSLPQRKHTWEVIGEEIGSGAYGYIHKVIDRESGEEKILKIFSSRNRKGIEREICYQNRAANFDIAPAITDYWFCQSSENKGAIVMEKAGHITLESFTKRIKDTPISDYESLLHALQLIRAYVKFWIVSLRLNIQADLFHFDLHLNNVMVTFENDTQVTDIKIIDFGEARTIDDVAQIIKSRVIDKDSSLDIFDAFQSGIKKIYADRLMPYEFLADLKKKVTDVRIKAILKFILYSIGGKFRRLLCTLRWEFWYPQEDSLKEYIDEFRDEVIGDLDELLETHLFKSLLRKDADTYHLAKEIVF